MATVIIFLLASILFRSTSGQNPSGFISLDCGLPANSSYIEPTTGINYDSDAAFIATGTAHNISDDHIKPSLKLQLRRLRSFPLGLRNCYNLKVRSGTKYLIRASFLYGDYDGRGKIPEFDLHFGANYWDSLVFDEIGVTVHKEIIHVASSSDFEVCLVNTGSGIPFISALELRPMKSSAYETGSRSLATFLRLDVGSINNQTYRYKDDIYDRVWVPMVPFQLWTSTSTSEQVSVDDPLFFQPSPAVMNTAATPKNASDSMEFNWLPPDKTTEFFAYLYFAELQKLQPNESRKFDVLMNGKPWYNSSISPTYLTELVIYSTSPVSGGTYDVSLTKTNDSTHPPILNAVEIYRVINFPQSETNVEDVLAIGNTKAMYGVGRNWQGDPCAPREFIWQGLNCSSVDSEPPRITSLDLSSSGLTGEIAQDIANLKMLETLDLSNNSLSGPLPDFLTQLSSLRVLNLERNNLSGLIPSLLIEKSNSGSLSLRVSENPSLLTAAASERRGSSIVAPVVASVAGFVVLLALMAVAIFWLKARRRKQDADESRPWEATKRQYSYSDILRITNNFERLLGEGGFGKVYFGCIEGTEVAVKMLSPQSAQGYQQFEAEVDLLMRVHHRNLTALVGYCNESTNKGLIYEYMARGNLGSIITGGRSNLLDWKDRLSIAVDSALGLEYLHSAIRPAIVHRDVKSSNILLDDDFRAKVSDFGLSRVSPTEGGATHVTTNVVGTHGYLDPEYFSSSRLNEKSDVYGFGVILLEIITAKPALTRTRDGMIHVYQWVGSLISRGDIRSIIDPKMKEEFDVNSVWKAVDIAMSCAAPSSGNRPGMSQVVVDLKECLAMELAARNKDNHNETPIFDTTSLFGPPAR